MAGYGSNFNYGDSTYKDLGPITITLIGIASGEAFGLPTVDNTSTPESALPASPPVAVGDIRLSFLTTDQYVDIIPIDRDVERDGGFETAVIITLVTDKAADVGDTLPEEYSIYKGGCWMDSVPPVPDFKMGSKLWLLKRAKTENEVPAMAKEILLDAFKWMIEDTIIDRMEVEVERKRDLRTTIAFRLIFYKPEDTVVSYRFYYNWEQQSLRRV